MSGKFYDRLVNLEKRQEHLLGLANEKAGEGNGVFDRYKYPVLTAQHGTKKWRGI